MCCPASACTLQVSRFSKSLKIIQQGWMMVVPCIGETYTSQIALFILCDVIKENGRAGMNSEYGEAQAILACFSITVGCTGHSPSEPLRK